MEMSANTITAKCSSSNDEKLGLAAHMVLYLCRGFGVLLFSLLHVRYWCNSTCLHGTVVPISATVNEDRKVLITFFLGI